MKFVTQNVAIKHKCLDTWTFTPYTCGAGNGDDSDCGLIWSRRLQNSNGSGNSSGNSNGNSSSGNNSNSRGGNGSHSSNHQYEQVLLEFNVSNKCVNKYNKH